MRSGAFVVQDLHRIEALGPDFRRYDANPGDDAHQSGVQEWQRRARESRAIVFGARCCSSIGRRHASSGSSGGSEASSTGGSIRYVASAGVSNARASSGEPSSQSDHSASGTGSGMRS